MCWGLWYDGPKPKLQREHVSILAISKKDKPISLTYVPHNRRINTWSVNPDIDHGIVGFISMGLAKSRDEVEKLMMIYIWIFRILRLIITCKPNPHKNHARITRIGVLIDPKPSSPFPTREKDQQSITVLW